MVSDDKLVFFGHHKCGSRFFRQTLLKPLAEANGYSVHAYSIRTPPFHFREAHELDLKNIDFEAFAQPGNRLLNLSNAGSPVVDAAFQYAPGLRGIHVLRDPRQVLVSGYFYHLKGHNIENPVGWVWDKLKEDRPQLESLPLEDGLLYELSNITEDVLRNQILPWKSRPEVLELRLEDCQGAYSCEHPVIKRLIDFLNLPVRPAIRFQQTFANPESRSWREVFTPRVTDIFKQKYGYSLIDLGYETSLDWC